jgi:MYXO-CTERM domain-containing protein
MKALKTAYNTALLTGAPLAMAHPGDHAQTPWFHTLASPDHAGLWIAAGVLGLALAALRRRRVRAETRRSF